MIHSRTLTQICDVLLGMRHYYQQRTPLQLAYEKAVHDTAEKFEVTYQTIGDGCRKRLGLSQVREFQSLVYRWLSGDGSELQTVLLYSAHPDLHSIIERFFEANQGIPASTDTQGKEEKGIITVPVNLDPNLAKILQAVAILQDSAPEAILQRIIKDGLQAESEILWGNMQEFVPALSVQESMTY